MSLFMGLLGNGVNQLRRSMLNIQITLNLNTIFKRIFLFKRNNIDKIVIFIGFHKMFPTALRGIHDRNITRKSGNNLLNGIETGGGLSRCVFRNNNLQRRHLIGLKRKAMIEYLVRTLVGL